jgi:hypothetical protein
MSYKIGTNRIRVVFYDQLLSLSVSDGQKGKKKVLGSGSAFVFLIRVIIRVQT